MANLYQRLMMQRLTPHDVARGAFNTSGFTPPSVARGNAMAMLNRAAVARGVVNGPLELKYVLGSDTTGIAGLGAFGAAARYDVFGVFQFTNWKTADAWVAWADENIPFVLPGASLNTRALYEAKQSGNIAAAGQFNLLAVEVNRAQQAADEAQGRLEEAEAQPAVLYMGVPTPNMARANAITAWTKKRTDAFFNLGELAKRAANIKLEAPPEIKSKDLNVAATVPGAKTNVKAATDAGVDERYQELETKAAANARAAELRERRERDAALRERDAALLEQWQSQAGPTPSKLPLILGGLALGGLVFYLARKKG